MKTCKRMASFMLRVFVVLIAFWATGSIAEANLYLAKPGEAIVKARIGTCAVTGGFMHLYAALDNRLFAKYGIDAEHVVVRGGGRNLLRSAQL